MELYSHPCYQYFLAFFDVMNFVLRPAKKHQGKDRGRRMGESGAGARRFYGMDSITVPGRRTRHIFTELNRYENY